TSGLLWLRSVIDFKTKFSSTTAMGSFCIKKSALSGLWVLGSFRLSTKVWKQAKRVTLNPAFNTMRLTKNMLLCK
ncbi:MAG: hypothetical protein KGZ39_08625, partial [Simkania sp.]|nr:hypothetical protein [Simkania sp.]MBS3905372.1 hypothetical protein [Simkania sp.]